MTRRLRSMPLARFAVAVSALLAVSLVGLALDEEFVISRASAQPSTPSSPAKAPPPSDGVPRDLVVARVADKTITLGELESRLAQVPPFMLAHYGSTPAEIKHRFLDEVMVRELVLNQGAIDAGLDKRADVEDPRSQHSSRRHRRGSQAGERR